METIHTITYVAFDGTKFTDKKECENYENNCIFDMLDDVGIKFFNKNFVPSIDIIEAIDAKYIYFPENEEAYDLYLKYFDSDVVPSFVDFAGKGLYYYDNNSYTYQLIKNKIGECCL